MAVSCLAVPCLPGAVRRRWRGGDRTGVPQDARGIKVSSLAETLWAWRVRFRVDVLAAGTHPLLKEQQASLPHTFVVPDRIARIQVQVGGQSLDVREGEAFVVARPQAYPIDVQPEPVRTDASGASAEVHGQAESSLWCPAHPEGLLIRLVPLGDVPAQLLAGCRRW